MAQNIQVDRLRPVIAQALPTLKLPPLVTVKSDLYRQHVSYRGAVHWRLELPEGDSVTDYERLEHVGDALLGAEATLMIHRKYPRLTVGVRALIKYAIIENVTLAQLAKLYDMPKTVLTSAAQASSIQSNPNVQACVFEAYLAAIYEEHGGETLRRFLRDIFEPLLPTLVNALREMYSTDEKTSADPASTNYVGKLGEWAIQKGSSGRKVQFSTPKRTPGPSHAPSWEITCTVSSLADALDSFSFDAVAGTVAKAKNASAQQACKYLELI
ncbi:hypothetical protein JCM10908_005853 [Rhodotorula pacifica]|uniref:uncharacterized protein n=1 Tax=Rhodotorula pacifica TaxID=1495444 RepID=UPI00317C2BBD